MNDRVQRQPGKIEGLLLHGAENALTISELLPLTGCADVQALNQIIDAEWENGALILESTDSKYFLLNIEGKKKGMQEIVAFVKILRARAISTLGVLKAAERALYELDRKLKTEGSCNDWGIATV